MQNKQNINFSASQFHPYDTSDNYSIAKNAALYKLEASLLRFTKLKLLLWFFSFFKIIIYREIVFWHLNLMHTHKSPENM